MKLSTHLLLSLVVIGFSSVYAGQVGRSALQPVKLNPVAATEKVAPTAASDIAPTSLTPISKEAYDAHNSTVNTQRSLVDNKMKEVEEKRKQRDEELAQLNAKAASMKANRGDHARVEQLNKECERLHQELVQHVRRLEDLMSGYTAAA